MKSDASCFIDPDLCKNCGRWSLVASRLSQYKGSIWSLIEHAVKPGRACLWMFYPPFAAKSVCGDNIVYINFLLKKRSEILMIIVE